MTRYVLLAIAVFPFLAMAGDDDMKEGVNYCKDPESLKSNENLLAKNPNDRLIIRLIALRKGLCLLIDEGKISLDMGIDIFTDEKNRAVVERSKEELTRHPEPLT